MEKHGFHPIPTEMEEAHGIRKPVYGFLKVEHNIHSAFEKSIIERTMQYIKDRTMNDLIITFLAERRNAN